MLLTNTLPYLLCSLCACDVYTPCIGHCRISSIKLVHEDRNDR